MREEVLRIERVTLKTGGIVHLDNMNLQMFKGEIMGLISLTSQGRKELIELLCSNTKINYGRVYLDSHLVNSYQNTKVQPNLVHVIGQNSRLIENLTVADNIFVMRRGLKKYLISRKLLRTQFYFWFEELETSINPDSLIVDLSRLERCIVELFRAIVAGCKLIIMQEIGSLLTADELDIFRRFILYYSKEGISFLYFGNHHEEVFRICNRVALMKNAKVVRIFEKRELTEVNIRPYTISFEIGAGEERKSQERGILDFQRVRTSTMKELSFSVHKDECVVFIDKSNTVLPDFIGLLCGRISADNGSIYYGGSLLTQRKASRFIENKILVIPKNPVENLMYGDLNYLENLCFLVDRKMKHRKITKKILSSIVEEYKEYIGDDIYAADVKNLEIRSQYNLIYYRVHLYNPEIVICIQPFSGLDMYLRRHVIDLIYQLRKNGITVVIWSVNVSDCLSVADRLVLLEDGHFLKSYAKEEFNYFKDKL